MEIQNFLSDIPNTSSTEIIQKMLEGESFFVERIISYGQASPEGFWYDQDKNEFILIVQGSAGIKLENESEMVVLTTGDYLDICAHVKHRVEWTDPAGDTIWLAVHY